jgi:hypothetical protein
VPRLKALADFFGVTPATLLGETGEAHGPSGGALVFDIEALRARLPDASVTRFAEAIMRQRGDFNGRVLSVRRDDLHAILAMVDPDPGTAMTQLRAVGVLLEPDVDASRNAQLGGGPDGGKPADAEPDSKRPRRTF